jgi:hypothetical protein
MSRTTYNKVFQNKENLDRMLKMRRQGWDVVSLGILFRVHPDSIDYQCIKHGIERGNNKLRLNITRILLITKIPTYKVKSYKDYLNESSYADYLDKHRMIK